MMQIEQFIRSRKLSLYELAERSGLSYSVVHNLVKGKSDIRKCTLDTAHRMANVLEISIEDLMLLCSKGRTFTWFRSEQCHQVHRKGELRYLIDVLESGEIDRYWRLSMYAEAMYEVAMIDYICRRNDLPRCENYNEIRRHKLDKTAYPIDVRLIDHLFDNHDAADRAESGAIPEFRYFNIIEGDIFDDSSICQDNRQR